MNIDLLVWKKEINFPITSNQCEWVRDVARKLSYLICILMGIFIFVEHDTKEQSSIFSFRSEFHELGIRLLCMTQLLVTLLFCYLWGRMRYRMALAKYD